MNYNLFYNTSCLGDAYSWTKYVETDCEFIQKLAELHLTKIVTKPHIYVKGTKKHYICPSETYINKTRNFTRP